MDIALALALGALGDVLLGWVTYLATIPRGAVPRRPVMHVVLQVLGVLGGAAAIAVAVTTPRRVHIAAVAAPAGVALMMGSLFLILLWQRKTPLGKLAVAVGDTLPSFSSTDSSGAPFDSASLAGKRVLLKFFRGSW